MAISIGSNAERYGLYGAAFAAAAALVAALTPHVMRLGERYGWVDKPDRRKVHSRAIPRIGGMAVFFGLLGAFAIMAAASPVARALLIEHKRHFLALAAGGTLVFVTGFRDDIGGLSPKVKLAVQSAAGLLAFYGGFHFAVFTGAPGSAGGQGHRMIFALLLTWFWIVGTINAVNLIDGLDGLASGITGIAMVALGIISEHNGHAATAFAAFLSAGAVAGFLIFNRHPASVFLGDSGSLLIGFLLAVLAIEGTQQGSLYASLSTPACLVFVPLLDVAFALLRRAQKGLPIASPDNQHIHHRLLKLGLPHRKVVHILWGFTLGAGALALLMHVLPNGYRHVLVNLVALGSLLWAVLFLGKLEMRATVSSLRAINRRKRTPREKILWLRKSLERIGACETAQGVLQSLTKLAAELELECLSVSMQAKADPEGVIEILRWNRHTPADGEPYWAWEEGDRDTVVASKAYAADPESTLVVELGRHAWKSRRRSEDFQLWANLVADALAGLGVFAIFSPIRGLPYSAILE
jgi:UDP-GlcNAc:undecaprenyl-phosphate GlcNAc-1-phosphate transferase